MAEYKTQTIKELIGEIQSGRVVLPAIQRNFVWPEEKIYHLFDSLMRDYPIGTFLFWEINEETFSNYIFNEFIQDYDEQKGTLQRGVGATAKFSDYKAVLDGQQRITSLFIGVCGKYRVHIRRRRWDDPTAYKEKYLCLDILSKPAVEEQYHFAFKECDDIETLLYDEDGNRHYWVKVATAFSLEKNNMDEADFIDAIDSENPGCFETSQNRIDSRKMLKQLISALCMLPNVNYYPAKEKDLSQVVDIFVRVNSGGEKLKSSDLMLSVAAGEQGDVDIHKVINDAVEEINEAPEDTDNGFVVDKEMVLTTGLMLTGAESLSLSRNENYSHERMNAIFMDHWEDIIEALKNAVRYVEYIGFIGKKLSKNILLPITYYFYKNHLTDKHKAGTSNRACCDRIFIRQWLLRATLNDVFSDGTGATLLAIRNLIDKTDKGHFPLEELMEKKIKKSLSIEEEQMEDILSIKYGDSKVVPIFCELLHVSTKTTDHVDHIWPKAILNSKKAIRRIYPMASDAQIATYKEGCNSIVNLQLLDGLENQQKSETEFDKWVQVRYANPDDQDRYCRDHIIPQGISYDLRDLEGFWEARRETLKALIEEAFPSDFEQLVVRYNLQGKL